MTPMLLMLAQAAAPSLATLPTAELVRRAFADPPAEITGHRVIGDPHLGAVTGVQFFTRAQPLGDGVCRRSVYHVGAEALGTPGAARPAPVRSEQLALAADCAGLSDDRFAYVNPPARAEDAATALRWLADRRRRGGAAGVTCLASTFRPDPCADGPATVLRALPLERTYIIDKGGAPGAWRLSVMPRGPGQLFYDVRMARDAGGRPVMTIKWDAPAPF